MVLLTFTIGILNICLGYALAVSLGYGPANMWDGWDALMGVAPAEDLDPALDQWAQNPLLQPSFPLAAGEGPAAGTPPETAAAAGGKGGLPAERSWLGVDPAWYLDDKLVETSILKFNTPIAESYVKLRETDMRLRAAGSGLDAATFGSCLSELEKDSREYLSQQARLAEQFHRRLPELGEMAAVGERIEMATLAASAQLETTLNELKQLDAAADLPAAAARLQTEIGSLCAARHALADNHEAAFLGVARHHQRLGQIDSRAGHDPLTGLLNRIGVEKTLWQWRQEEHPRAYAMGVILLDLDGFSRFNVKHGVAVGDRLLAAVAHIVRQVSGGAKPPAGPQAVGDSPEGTAGGQSPGAAAAQAYGDAAHVAARYGGARFMVAMTEAGPRALQEMGERLRQALEKTVLLAGDERVAVSASVGIAAAVPNESTEMLLFRVERALQHAQQMGPNHTSFDGGEQLAAVQPLDLKMVLREVTA